MCAREELWWYEEMWEILCEMKMAVFSDHHTFCLIILWFSRWVTKTFFSSSVSMATFSPSLLSICHLLFYYLHLLITCYYFFLHQPITSFHALSYLISGFSVWRIWLIYTSITSTSIFVTIDTCFTYFRFFSSFFSQYFINEMFIVTFYSPPT